MNFIGLVTEHITGLFSLPLEDFRTALAYFLTLLQTLRTVRQRQAAASVTPEKAVAVVFLVSKQQRRGVRVR